MGIACGCLSANSHKQVKSDIPQKLTTSGATVMTPTPIIFTEEDIVHMQAEEYVDFLIKQAQQNISTNKQSAV